MLLALASYLVEQLFDLHEVQQRHVIVVVDNSKEQVVPLQLNLTQVYLCLFNALLLSDYTFQHLLYLWLVHVQGQVVERIEAWIVGQGLPH